MLHLHKVSILSHSGVWDDPRGDSKSVRHVHFPDENVGIRKNYVIRGHLES